MQSQLYKASVDGEEVGQSHQYRKNRTIASTLAISLAYCLRRTLTFVSMYFVIFEGTVPSKYATLGERFYTTLLPLLHESPGFIAETPFASTTDPDGQLELATFTDAEAVNTWRVQPTHLTIERTGREKVFEEYRIRVGPEAEGDEETQVVLLYQRLHSPDAGKLPGSMKDLLGPDADPEVLKDMNDEGVYKSEKTTLWLSSWNSNEVAIEIEKAIPRAKGDTVQRVGIVRDYTKVNREQIPGRENEAVELAEE